MIALLRYWRLGLAALAVAALVGGWLMLKAAWAEKDAAELREKVARGALDTAVAANEHNVREIERYQAELGRQQKAVREEQAISAARAAQLRAIRAEIVADANDACPVAPVVLRTLDGLRSLRAAPAGGDADQGRAGGAASGAADVPERP